MEENRMKLPDGRELITSQGDKGGMVVAPSPSIVQQNNQRKKQRYEHEEMYEWFLANKDAIEELLRGKE